MLLNDPMLYGVTLPYGDIPMQSPFAAGFVPPYVAPWQNLARFLPHNLGISPYQQYQQYQQLPHLQQQFQPWQQQFQPWQQQILPWQQQIQPWQQQLMSQFPMLQQFTPYTPFLHGAAFTPYTQAIQPFNLTTCGWQRPFVG